MRGLSKGARRAALVIAPAAALLLLVPVVREPIAPDASPLVVNDVTQLNPIAVAAVITPTETQEIVDAVTRASGPVAVGGARHSMGGQIATAGALHIDMRRFNKIITFSPADKAIRVQAGARWREIQEHIDAANLSVAIMQSYASFTVGGSLSVNVHGRSVGSGPIVDSVTSLEVVLADGSVVEASRSQNADIFNGVIGGYGGLGVITEVTLALTDNVKLKRQDRTIPVTGYRRHFLDHVGGSPTAVFHNGDLYPGHYGSVRAITFDRTDAPLTVGDRLRPSASSHRLDRLALWVASEVPLGHAMRQYLVDPLRFRGEPVVWRNYEASYDAAELEPASRARSTYVLQEYFVPVERFDEFVPLLRDVLKRRGVNVINVSIRHAKQDRTSLLAWARTDVFAFVIYYKQGTSPGARADVGVWTRELIEAALRLGGSYYLPYQVHATETQFLRAYPRASEFFALKRRLDPTNKFRNELWTRYYRQ